MAAKPKTTNLAADEPMLRSREGGASLDDARGPPGMGMATHRNNPATKLDSIAPHISVGGLAVFVADSHIG